MIEIFMIIFFVLFILGGWGLYLNEILRVKKPNKIHLRWRDNGEIHISTYRSNANFIIREFEND